jgi:hypothetical protein
MRTIKESAPLKFKRVELVLVEELPVGVATGVEGASVATEPRVPELGAAGARGEVRAGIALVAEAFEGARVKPGGSGLVWL